MRYFRTESGHVATEDDQIDPPEDWTEIDEDAYEALVAADQKAIEDAAREVQLEANQRWNQVYDDLSSAGIPDATAELLANVVGVRPE